MTNDQINEVLLKGRSDGAKLYVMAEVIYKALIVFNWFFGILGMVLTLVAASKGGIEPALGVFLLTSLVCAFGYAIAVLGSYSTKAIVHILFCNLAALERESK